MKIARLLILSLILFFVSPRLGFSDSVRLSGWWAYWSVSEGQASLTKNLNLFDDILIFNYAFDENGNVINNEPDFSKSLNDSNVTVLATIVNDVIPTGGGKPTLKDPGIIHKILSDPALRKQHIQQIINIIEQEHFSGIDIDYESLNFNDRDIFSQFIQELSSVLKPKGYWLSVTVEEKIKDKKNNGQGAMDCAALSQYADEIRIMCYNYSSLVSDPGPIAPPSWLQEIILFAKSQIPLNKITIALALHGFDWSSERNESITFAKAMERAATYKAKIRRDKISATPYFSYEKNNKKHTVWFEDYKSIYEKLKIIKKQGIHAVALWKLGGEDVRIYSILKKFKD